VHHDKSDGYLSDPVARAWGDLFNHRFRWLLVCLEHYLRTDVDTLRSVLTRWAFAEMKALSAVARILGTLPQHDPVQIAPDGRPRLAGAPFELPYTMALPDRPADMWRHHEMIAVHSLAQLAALTSSEPLVEELRADTEARLRFIRDNRE
jgi:hypothetical protein